MASRDYVMPRWGSSNDRIAGYLREAVQEGAAWLDAQKPAAEFESLLERFGPTNSSDDLSGQSNAQYPKAERMAREIVASLNSFSHIGEVKPESKAALYDQAADLTKLDHHWCQIEQSTAALRKCIQYMVGLGTGYGWQQWDRHFYGEYRGETRLTALGPTDVTFVQLPKDHDIQRAYITFVREELPINLAKRIYSRTNPAFAEALRPDRDSPGWIRKGLRKVQEFVSPALRARGTRPGDDDDASFPTVDIYHAYILDGSINTSGQPMPMGATGTNWSYTVPSLGDEMPTALINPRTGQRFTRPADSGDCLLFPLRRYTIFSRSTDIIGYDGSSPWWHGLTPVVKFFINDWPWDALGRSAVGMMRTLEDSANAILQGMEDSIAGRLDPPVLYDDQKVSTAFAQAFNPRKAGSRAAADLSQGVDTILKYPVPPEYFNVPGFIPEHLQWLDEHMEYLSGARDLVAIMKARQLPSSDGLEKLLEMAGPLVQDMVKSLTLPYQQLGQMRLSDVFQFYTYDRLITSTNADTGDPEDWVFTPDTLLGYQPTDTVEVRRARAKHLLSEFTYRVSQSGVTDLNRMTTKLFYLQLMKGGFPIDPWTFAKIAQIPNFAAEPEGTHTVLERWVAWKRMEMEFAQIATEGQVAATGGHNPPGRPSTNAKPPHIQSKDGGARSTVVTS